MVEFKCPRCCYSTEHKTNIIKHINRKKLCELDNLDVDPKDYKDIILRDIDPNDHIKLLLNQEKEKKKRIDEFYKIIKEKDEENKKLNEKLQGMTKGGYIYVLHNPAFETYGEHVYKIGCSVNPERRKKDFSTMYVSGSNIVYTSKFFPNKLKAEKYLFDILEVDRYTKNREFFDVDIDTIVRSIKTVEIHFIVM